MKTLKKCSVEDRLTLLDIVANGVFIQVFRERVVVVTLDARSHTELDRTVRTRLAMSVQKYGSHRNHHAVITHHQVADLQFVLLQANKIAQLEIQRVTSEVILAG